jgi:HAD superfamily hydrolase (TIGR01549 family)
MAPMVCHPHALLLDFGGVIVDAPSLPPAPTELVRRVHELVAGAVSDERIERDLVAGAREYATWRDQVSNAGNPVELRHEQIWGDFMTRRWPEAARQAVRRQATELSYQWALRPDWAVVPGMTELLAQATRRKIPVAVVSNTMCGAAHRDFLAKVGLTDRFAAQLYSDEVGVRKPNPAIALRAAAELGVPIELCWFVGDSPSRDIACARRAGVGLAVLMTSARTRRDNAPAGVTPDVVVEDGHALLSLLTQP